MASKKGSLFLLIQGPVGSPEVRETILTSRSTEFTIGNNLVDVTTKGSSGWRTGLDAGIRNMSVSIDGVFEAATYEETINGFSINGGFNPFEIVNEDNDTWGGSFIVTSYGRSGTFDGEETYAFTLESVGTVNYTAGS